MDLDRADFDRVLPAAPGSADWDDVLGRFRAHRGRRRRRAVVLAVAVLAVAVGTTSAIGGLRDFFLDRGFIGLPPGGATSSAPESGELVAHWVGFTGSHETHDHAIFRAWVYADGRIVWDRRAHSPDPRGGIPEGANWLFSGYLEQRLTPDGVEIVRSAVAELFDRSRSLLETVPADAGPLFGAPGRLALFLPAGVGVHVSTLEAPEGDRLARLEMVGVEADYAFEHHQGTFATPEQLAALRRIDALFIDAAPTLPASAWAVREVRAYVPSHYAACIDTTPPKDAPQVLSMLPARAAELLRDKPRTASGIDLQEGREGGEVVVVGRASIHCFRLATEEAHEVAGALSGLEREPGWGSFALAFRVTPSPMPEPAPQPGLTKIWFEPYFPDGRLTFSGPFG
jgi:hypothetical protein